MNFLIGTTTIEGLDTSKILFVLGGAFEELYEYEKARKKIIGFTSDEDAGNSIIETSTIRDNMLRCGVQKEFLGRIDSIIRLKKLTELELKCILLHPNHGIIAKKRKEYKLMGLDLEFSKDLIQEIIKMALDEDLGARGVSSIIESILQNYDFYMLKHGEKYNYMYLDLEVLEGGLPQFASSREDFIDGQKHFVASAQK